MVKVYFGIMFLAFVAAIFTDLEGYGMIKLWLFLTNNYTK